MKRWIVGVVIIFLPVVAQADIFEGILSKDSRITIEKSEKEEVQLVFKTIEEEAKKFGLSLKDAKIVYRLYRAYVLTQTKPKTVIELVSYVGMCRHFYDKNLVLFRGKTKKQPTYYLEYIPMTKKIDFINYIINDIETRMDRSLPYLWKQIVRDILKEEK